MASKAVIVGISAILVGASAVGGYAVGSAKGDTVTQFRLTQDVTAGQPLEGNYEEAQVNSRDSVSKDALILDEGKIKSSIAYTNMYKHQAITSGSIGDKLDKVRNFDFAMPTTVEGSVANSIKPDEMVAIKVKYKDTRDDAVVVPFIPVSQIRTSNGAKVSSDSEVPSFLLFVVSNDENTDLNNASKEGTLFVVRYHDLNQTKLEKTYKKGQIPSMQGIVTGTGTTITPENSTVPSAVN